MAPPCPFCAPAVDDEVVMGDGLCIAVLTRDRPAGSAMVMPKVHRLTPFDLTDEEWMSSRRLLGAMKDLLGPARGVAAWNIGWNVGGVAGQTVEHVHCHLVARYDVTNRWACDGPGDARM